MQSRPRLPHAGFPARAHRRHDGVLPSARDRSARRLLPLLPRRWHGLRRSAPAPGQQHALRLQLRDGGTRVRQRCRVSTTNTSTPRAMACATCATCIAIRAAAAMPGRSATASPKTAPTTAYGVAFVLLAYSTALQGRHRRSSAVDGRDLGAARSALLGRCGRPVPRRGRRRLALQRLPRPERQHAHVRGDAGRLRGQRRTPLPRSRADAGRPHDAAPGGESRRPGVGTLRPRLERRLGLPPRRSQAPVPPLGIPARPSDRMGEAAADPRRSSASARPPRTGCCRPRGICSTPRWRGPGTTNPAACTTASPRTAASATTTSISGCRPNRSPRRRGWRHAPATSDYWDWYDRLWAYSWRHLRRSPAWRLVPHPRSRQPQVQRREESRRQDRLPHDGRLLRRAARTACQTSADETSIQSRTDGRPRFEVVDAMHSKISVPAAGSCRRHRRTRRCRRQHASNRRAQPHAVSDAEAAQHAPSASRPNSCTPGSGYRRYAWGHDALKPLSKAPHDWYAQSLLMTPVDALDTHDPDGPGRRGQARRAN